MATVLFHAAGAPGVHRTVQGAANRAAPAGQLLQLPLALAAQAVLGHLPLENTQSKVIDNDFRKLFYTPVKLDGWFLLLIAAPLAMAFLALLLFGGAIWLVGLFLFDQVQRLVGPQ